MRKLIQSTYIASTINFVSNHKSTEKKTSNFQFIQQCKRLIKLLGCKGDIKLYIQNVLLQILNCKKKKKNCWFNLKK